MKEYSCPNCGAPLEFRSSVSVYTTCTSCRSMIVRHDMELENLGVVSELLNDNSPLQVGTMGTFNGAGFILLGRIKLVYDRGMWSEWYASFDDGRQGWLADAQGFYMMSFPLEGFTPPATHEIGVGLQVRIDKTTYTADDIQEVTYAGSEGELPFIFRPGFKAKSVDMRSSDGGFVSILYGPDEIEVFAGRYESFDNFDFKYLKELDGWSRT